MSRGNTNQIGKNGGFQSGRLQKRIGRRVGTKKIKRSLQLSACWKPPPQGWYISLIQHLIKMVTLLVRCLSEIQKEILREHRQKRIVSWMSSTKATIAKFALAIAEDLAYNKINCKKGMPLW